MHQIKGYLPRGKGKAVYAAGALLIAAAAMVVGAKDASAQFSIFESEMFAQLHCPSDKIVWVDFKKRRYYTKGQRLYGQGARNGTFVCEKEARRSGYRASRTGLR